MKNSIMQYSVGPLLYCPANNEGIASSIINETFGSNFSLALCLEDTIGDDFVEDAERILIKSISKIHSAVSKSNFYIPKIFIRVRNPKQIHRLYNSLEDYFDIISGFIAPKFNIENSRDYIDIIDYLNKRSKKDIYFMPILEDSSIINIKNRAEILYELKENLRKIEKYVLNIRVGGNDLCGYFGLRRKSYESIHDIKPVSDIFSDIVSVFGSEYIISAPVWEYFNGENWESGLINEIRDDKLAGFIGKTVIHPNQIKPVIEQYKVSKSDYEDAMMILNWNKNSESLVSSNSDKTRMNEFKTHYKWAEKIYLLAEVYGIK